METVDAAAIRPVPASVDSRRSLLSWNLVDRAAAIARGDDRRSTDLSTDEQRGVFRGSEARARRAPRGLGDVVALDFLGDAIAGAAVDRRFEPGEARAAVIAAAADLDLPAEAAAFIVFRRALASAECNQLPPAVAVDLAVALLVELSPAAAASLWEIGAGGATQCLVAHGKAPRSRGAREAARKTLHGLDPGQGQIRVRLVQRWDRPHAALVIRATASGSPHLEAYLAEAATALVPMLERSASVDSRLENERHLVAAGERRLVRLGADLHDGPLQDLVLLADDLRLASRQFESVVPEEDRLRVRGRFADLHARLESLDQSLREIARATRSTATTAAPVEETLGNELLRLERATGIEATFHAEGDLSGLTDSQKIVLFRVAQEALSNVRRHSRARKVTIVLQSTRTFLDLVIRDDGCGFDLRKVTQDRLGLAGISERVRLLGGVVEIESSPGAGAQVRALLPQWRPTSAPVGAVAPVGP